MLNYARNGVANIFHLPTQNALKVPFMVETASTWVQIAAYNLMKNDSILASKIHERIYDSVPSEAMMPYVRISDITESPQNTLNSKIRDLTLTLNVWSDYGGNQEIFDIMGDLNRIFDCNHTALNTMMATLHAGDDTVLNSYTAFYSAYEYSQTLEQGKFMHGVLRYRIRVRLNG